MHSKFVIVYFVSLYVATMSVEYNFNHFQIFVNKSAKSPTGLESHVVSSVEHCASLCLSLTACVSFSLNCLAVKSGGGAKQNCNLYSSSVSSDLDLEVGNGCYIQKETLSQGVLEKTSTNVTPRTTVETTTKSPSSQVTTAPGTAQPTTASTYVTLSTTVETTTKSPSSQVTTAPGTAQPTSASTVIDIVYGPRDMCFSGSNSDLLMLTPQGVFVYNEISDLIVASCAGPLNYTNIFSDYPQLPAITNVRGVLLYQTSNVELYANDDYVYMWQIETGNLNSVLGSRSYSSLLGTTQLDGQDFKWAAYRQGSSQERHFYLGGDNFFLKSDQHGTHTYNKTDDVPDMNGFNMNPWSDIPADTIAVTGYGSEPNKNFVLIDSRNMVYTYQLDFSVDNNNPTKTLTALNAAVNF